MGEDGTSTGLWFTFSSNDGSHLAVMSITLPEEDRTSTYTLYLASPLPWLASRRCQRHRGCARYGPVGGRTRLGASTWVFDVVAHGDPPAWLHRATLSLTTDQPRPPFGSRDIALEASNDTGGLSGRIHLERAKAR